MHLPIVDFLPARVLGFRGAPASGSEPALNAGPGPRPAVGLESVNAPQTETEVETLRECIRRRRALGELVWSDPAAGRLSLVASLRPRGRPRKPSADTPSLFDRTIGQR